MRPLILLALATAVSALSGCGSSPVLPSSPAPEAQPRPWQSHGASTRTERPPAVLAPAPATTQMPPAPLAGAPQAAPASAVQFVEKPLASYQSLAPHITLNRGEGVGYLKRYGNLSKDELVALLRNPALWKQKFRVPCERVVAQMVEGHPALPFEGCEGTAAAIAASADFSVVACRDGMLLKDSRLTATNKKVTGYGAWQRPCYPGERLLAFRGKPILSLYCGNVLLPVLVQVAVRAPPAAPPLKAVAPVVPATPAFTTSACPKGYTLIANVWQVSMLPRGSLLAPGLHERAKTLIQAAKDRPSEEATLLAPYREPSFSRTLGKELRREVMRRADVDGRVGVRFLDPQTGTLVAELGSLELAYGVGSSTFAQDPRQYIVETIWPMYLVSPVISGGERRLRLFPNEWDGICTMNVHGAVP